MWAKNPVPRAWRDQHGAWGSGSNQMQTGEGFQPVCVDHGIDPYGTTRSCTSEWGTETPVLSECCTVGSSL